MRKYKTVEALKKTIEEYFDNCIDKEEIPSPAGLQWWMGITSGTMSNYRTKPEYAEFNDLIRGADKYIEHCTVQAGYGNHSSFAQFMLSRKFKYVEKQEIEHSGEIDIIRRAVDESEE
jgi:hypothetical protein